MQRGGEPLPTFAQLCGRVVASKKVTVRDVWGLMLTALPGHARPTDALARLLSSSLNWDFQRSLVHPFAGLHLRIQRC